MKRKETAVRSDIIDPDQQRRLITDQVGRQCKQFFCGFGFALHTMAFEIK